MIGTCEHCNKSFNCEIFHCGFAESSYAYCDRCGQTALLSGWSKYWPSGVKCTQREISEEIEPFLSACDCGGNFKKGSSPRCPHCGETLSASDATEYIERQS